MKTCACGKEILSRMPTCYECGIKALKQVGEETPDINKVTEAFSNRIMRTRAAHVEKLAAAFLVQIGGEGNAGDYILCETYDPGTLEHRWWFEKKGEREETK